MSILVDIFILATVLLCLIRGYHIGFVRALCAFLSLFVAVFGAILLARFLTPPLVEALTPRILPRILEQLAQSDLPQSISEQSTEHLLTVLGLPASWSGMLSSLMPPQDPALSSANLTEWIASSILQIVLSAVVFMLGFFLLQLLWRFVQESLQLVSKLPILKSFNHLLGVLVGAVNAVIFLMLLRWLVCDLLGFLSPETLANTYTHQLFAYLSTSLPQFSTLLW